MVGKIATKQSPMLPKIQKYLSSFEFDLLFQELGWDNPTEKPLLVSADGHDYVLRPLVEKRQVKAFLCGPGVDGKIPSNPTLLKIEREVTRLGAFEHFIVYIDAAKTQQAWQWVLRSEKRTRNRIKRFYKGQNGEALALHLYELHVSLEEELSLGAGDVIKKLKRAFDTEKVTKKFYDLFKQQHTDFCKLIEGIDNLVEREWYASFMLNRLMFVYFIQKKGWLNGDPDYLWNKLELSKNTNGVDQFHTFYRYFLLVLFHDGLGKRERSPELEHLLGRVPYLNGGLFEVHKIEQQNRHINIPDSAFDQIFKFFNGYDWYLDDRPLRKDNEINPDVLGYIFEKYINQKQMGAYYTKEDITEYISKNTIIPFLLDAAENECAIAFRPDGPVWALLREDPDTYVYEAVKKGVALELPAEIAKGLQDVSQREGWNRPAADEYALPTETWREVVARRARYKEVYDLLAEGKVTAVNDLITYNLDIRRFAVDVITYCGGSDLLQALYKSITHISVLDPTCGSGAFLFVALNILEDLYEACLDRMQDMIAASDAHDATLKPSQLRRHNDIELFRALLKNADSHKAGRTYFIYKSIIIYNLFGVDIMEEATEICKLRLFLKLASQITTYEQIEPLPDIDFNIRAGNTLVGFASKEETQQALQFRNVGNGVVQSQMIFDDRLERVEEQAKEVEEAFALFRDLQTETELKSEVLAEAKQRLRDRLANLRTELDGYMATIYGIEQADFDGDQAKYQTALLDWQRRHQAFHWWVEFYGIWANGGFDVIIGNPPYVEYSKVRKGYQIVGYFTEKSGNLYNYVVEQCTKILKSSQGQLGFIIPLGGFYTERMHSYQNFLKNHFGRFHISHFSGDAHPSILFQGVKYRLSIVLANKTKNAMGKYTSNYNRWYADLRDFIFPTLNYEQNTLDDGYLRFAKTGTTTSRTILQKMLQKKPLMGTFLQKSGEGHINYHRSPVFWIRAMNFEPYFHSATRDRSLDHLRDLYCSDQRLANVVGAIINSTCFYYWFIIQGNCRDIAGPDISSFPMGDIDESHMDQLQKAFLALMEDLNFHSKRRVYNYEESGRVEYQEFYPKHSKPIIDEIDRVLAQHYGFTNEELDFIINYDIKYRMGRDGAESDDEEE